MSAPAMDASLLERDMAALGEGIRLLFVNEFQAAEETFKRGAQRERLQASQGCPGCPTRDTRGVFALVWTLVSLMFGLLSFANDQLDECLRRVQMAESLLLEDSPWVGQRMLLGFTYIIAGVVHAAKNAWIKAGVNFVRALRYIREFADGLTYEGPEQAVVRSTALYALGLFNLVLSMLPPQLLGLASRAGGEALQGNQAEALRLLSTCHAEEGIMAPFAAVVLILHHISIKTYLGEETSPQDVATSRELLEWARGRFPNSAVFNFWQTELHAALQEIAEASTCVGQVHEALAHLQLPAVDSFLEQKKAYLNIAVLSWSAAASGSERSLAVSVARNRRSYVPFLSYLAGLCYLIDGNYEGSRLNFDRVTKYSKLRKWNWPPEDDLAFSKVKESVSLPSFGAFCALLDLLEVSMLKLHLLHTMPDSVKRRLNALLEDTSWCNSLPQACRARDSTGESSAAPEEVARAWLFRAELARLLRDEEGARQLALRGLEVAPRLGPRGAANGTAALLHLTLALLGEREHLKALDRCPRACRAFDEALKFKRLGVGKRAAAAAGQTPGAEQEQQMHGTQAPLGEPQVPMEEEEEWPEEFFSAEEDNDSPMQDAGLSGHGHGAESPKRKGRAMGSPYGWASKSAAKAWRGLSKAIGHNMPELPSLVGGSPSNGLSSSLLHLEALQQQADQGDCSIVSMPLPHRGASRDEVVAYLRWVQWSSLRGMPRQEALRRYTHLASSPEAVRDAALQRVAAEAVGSSAHPSAQ